jgi:hypothetical protein
MTLSRACIVSIAVVSALAAGCGSSDSAKSDPPDGIACSSVTSGGGSSGTLAGSLSAAQTGSCIVLEPGIGYSGTFVVPSGVTLTGPRGARSTISAGTGKDPLVTLGEGAKLVNVDVVNATAVGVAVRAANATLQDVHVTGAKTAAVGILCTGDGCGSGVITLKDLNLEKSELGLWVSGAHVAMSGGRSGENGGTGLTSGLGIVAANGAKLELDGVTVEKNQATAVLIDGAQTTATINNSTIQDNSDRGVWAQKVAGSLSAPAVQITGSTIVRNKIVGVGSVEARGIIIVGGRVAETQAAPVVTNLAATEQVGDGFGVFSQSTDWKIDGTVVEANVRAAGLIDDGSKQGIIIVGGKISAGASGYKVVVQGTDASAVQLADTDKSSAPELGVSSPKISLPPVL